MNKRFLHKPRYYRVRVNSFRCPRDAARATPARSLKHGGHSLISIQLCKPRFRACRTEKYRVSGRLIVIFPNRELTKGSLRHTRSTAR